MALGGREKSGQYAACRQIRTLLLQVGPYRDKWESYARSIESGEINQTGVCHALALYLWDSGERSEFDKELPRKLKDRVSDVMQAVRISRETMRWFVEAFDLSPHDSRRVYDLYRGEIELKEIVGSLPPPDPKSGFRPIGHRTELLFEHHFIGRDGTPAHHHSQQAIYSLVDGLASYQYRIDTAEAEVRVKRGGKAGQVYPIAHDCYAIDITFPHPLGLGESHYLDYWTNFHYLLDPPAEFRRGAHQRVEHLDMRVEFHREKKPSRLWWAEWSDYLDESREIVERKEVALDEERSGHRYLNAIEHAVVGFLWEW